MRNHLRRYAIGALAVGAVAGATAIALPASGPAWQPVTHGLTATPAQLLPANVSTAEPVRVVSTTIDRTGRPVVTTKTATDRETATELVDEAQEADNAVAVDIDTVVTALGVPTGTDTYRGQQWDFTKIRVATAWQRSTGAGVKVAVIDSGVEATHPDLAGQVLPGVDIISGTEGVSTDPNGHGTHVAGTIAALTGNGLGVSAVAPDTRILPVRVLSATGSGWSSDIAKGIIWAADHGANVINMSLGGSGQDTATSNAVAYARSKGVTVIAAAGNSRLLGSPVNYPAADAGVIAVAATDSNDKVAGYSNQGSYVDVAAPGSAIASTVPVGQGSYAYKNGTSMAAPHVAAVAALLKAYNPSLTPDAIERALTGSAVDLGATGKDTDFGYGRIDAVAALDAVTTTTPATPVTTVPTTAPTTVAPTPTKTSTPTPTTTVTPKPTPSKTVTPTPSKTTPVKKVRPTVKSVSTSPAWVVHGTTVTVTYTVTVSGKPLANQPVRIGTTPAGGTITWADATTNASGVVTFSKPATGRFQVKMTVPVSDTTLEATSSTITFGVKSQATVTSPAAGTLKVALSGAAGQKVQVQRLDKRRWVVATTYVASSPDYTLDGLTAKSQYRIVMPATVAITGLTSAVVTIS
jgi:type VII secretion-associated serine protease mycosin